jgi:polar amino acid transport system substrate-binding protein
MNIPRRPFYEKELQLRLSTSYGPGRYDPQYEEKGIDYPQAYVPWTEQRNMSCVLDLISQGKVDVKSLITHRFPIEQAEEAYKLVKGQTNEPYLGIILTYPKAEERPSSPVIESTKTERQNLFVDKIGTGVIGSGNFANLTMLPTIKKIADYAFIGIADKNGLAAKHSQEKFSFSYSAGDFKQLLTDQRIQVIFITTRHDSHALLAIEALRSGKHVMVEKPLCLNEEQLLEIVKVVRDSPGQIVMVGFNRRFAPMSVELKKRFKDKGPLSINYICNAGFVPKDSWAQDPGIGGGRIIGEACHFIDWMVWFVESPPIKVYSQSIGRETKRALKQDNVMISLQFKDGSIGTISYLAGGDKSFTKEHIQVYGGGCIGIINDFSKGCFISNGITTKLRGSSKGHLEQWQALAGAIKDGRASPIPFEEIVASTWTTLKSVESLNCGQAIKM